MAIHEMNDMQLQQAHQYALEKQTQINERLAEIEWHMTVRQHIIKQMKLNKINELKRSIAAIEADL